ncbi:unnamed protein product [Toxocara canis]|uniref:non-specific serine/threonine protein kinase n=1 Tax=Toxocara canis TaxID=6265 RepID=A0A183UIG7_TOXCA|nr:unnamed protein product [Toxocara canis]
MAKSARLVEQLLDSRSLLNVEGLLNNGWSICLINSRPAVVLERRITEVILLTSVNLGVVVKRKLLSRFPAIARYGVVFFKYYVRTFQDALIALVEDCSYPALRSSPTISSFVSRYKDVAQRIREHRLQPSDFRVIKVIGRGAFGEVRLVRHTASENVYAMKVLNKNDMIRRADSAFFWEERDIMAHAKSEWIVRLHYAFQDSRFLYLVMEYLPGGDMVSVMESCHISENWARFYSAELVLAVNALHDMGYVHRDVKPDNMLIARSGHIKLADFGTCVHMAPDGTVKYTTAIGTPDYISPELLNGNNEACGREIDWWSVGVVVYEMIVGETPFYADSLIKTYARIRNHKDELNFPSDVEMSINAKDLIRRFLSDREQRLGRDGVDSIKRHDFFKSDEWTFDSIRNVKSDKWKRIGIPQPIICRQVSAIPPLVPDLKGDDDTSYFDEVTVKETGYVDSMQIPKSFMGTQLPFIGFTYSGDSGLIAELQKATKSVSNAEERVAQRSQEFSRLETLNSHHEAEKDEMGEQLMECEIEKEELRRCLERQQAELNTKALIISALEKELSMKSSAIDRVNVELSRQMVGLRSYRFTLIF